ncbi:MAG: AI-2E family transporter [Anaerolineae bacterium]|nr:AI-2E family transporter [Gemmatimonadaceae bacterium]
MEERRVHDNSVLEPDVDPTAQATPASPDAEEPNLTKTAAAIESPKSRSVGVTVLAVLALLYTLYFARDFLLPISFALLLSFLLSPLVRILARFRIPPPIGSALVMLALLGILGLGTYELARPVQSWAAKAPGTMAAVQQKLTKLRRPIERVTETAEQVQNAATDVAGATKATEVVVKEPSLTSRIFGTTQRLLAASLEVAFLLYFLLAAGDLFLQKLIKVLPNVRDKRKAVEIARETESSISTYLLTALIVNILEGVVVGFAMWLLGMPNPALWGALVVLLEFIPYVGAAAMVLILGIAAITTFDSLGHALLVPATFLIINLVQANVVSPMLLGHRLALNPVALFVGLAFWFWIWGIPGAFIAVPLLATFKIFCDHIETLASVGEFLGTRDENERRAIVR